MSKKRIIDLEDSSGLDINDFVAVYNAEPVADNFTYKERISKILDLKTITVNGKTGSSITINADDISDTGTAKKFVSSAEINRINIVRTDLGDQVFLSGDGSYKQMTSGPVLTTTVMVVAENTVLLSSSNLLVLCDTTLSGFNVFLPVAPADKQIVRVKDLGNALNNPLMINSSHLIESHSNAIINTNFGSIELIFIQAVNKWIVSSILS